MGDGNTSRVYLGRDLEDSKNKVAIKVFKQEFFKNNENAVHAVENEISILLDLDHPRIYKVISYGTDGVITKPSGRQIQNLVYIIVDYVPGGLLFDVCKLAGAMGEDAGRYFMNQITDVLSYLHDQKETAHRDLKLENILLTKDLQLVLADFGFATYRNIGHL